jgi:uncharacterized repeat protein (TIGR03943 family)
MFAWIAAYLWLMAGKRYVQYIEAGLQPLLVIALVISILFLVALIARPSGRNAGHPPLAVLFNTGLLILPIVYTFAVPPDGLGDYARTRRVAYMESTRHDKGRPPIETDTTVQLPDHNRLDDKNVSRVYEVSLTEIVLGIDSLAGKHIETIGRVSRDTVLPDGYFFVFRFVITCCAAHAMPMSLPVREDVGVSQIKDDDWIEITGSVYPEKMAIGGFVFDSIPVIYPVRLRKIEPPQNPYLSLRPEDLIL